MTLLFFMIFHIGCGTRAHFSLSPLSSLFSLLSLLPLSPLSLPSLSPLSQDANVSETFQSPKQRKLRPVTCNGFTQDRTRGRSHALRVTYDRTTVIVTIHCEMFQGRDFSRLVAYPYEFVEPFGESVSRDDADALLPRLRILWDMLGDSTSSGIEKISKSLVDRM